MKKEDLQKIFEQEQVRELSWKGLCHDCGIETEVVIRVEDDGKINVSDGAVYKTEENENFLKCCTCYEKDPVLRNYQPMEVYSRVVGYLRPVGQYNPAKQEEFKERKNFTLANT